MAKTNFPGGVVAPFTAADGTAVAPLTDSSGGTATDTIPAIGGSYSQADIADAIASITAKVNALMDAQSS